MQLGLRIADYGNSFRRPCRMYSCLGPQNTPTSGDCNDYVAYLHTPYNQSHVSKTLVSGEAEFLFAPYSVSVHVSTVVGMTWCGHDTTVQATLTLTLILTLIIPGNCCEQVFQVQSIKWSHSSENAHQIVLQAAIDNTDEDENLPLSPWF